MPYSSASQWMGLGLETTRATAAALKWFLPFKSPDWTPEQMMLEDTGIRGSEVDVYDQVAGPRYDTFGWDCSVYADTFPALLRAALGSVDTVTGAGPYTHKIGLLNQASAQTGTAAGQPPSYTLGYFDGLDFNQLVAAQLDTLALKWSATELLTATVKFIAQSATQIAAPVDTFSAVPPIPAWNCIATIGGVAVTRLVSGEFTMNRGTKPMPAVTGTQQYYLNFAGPLSTKGSKMTVIMETDAELNYFLSNTKGEALDLKWSDGSGDSIEIHYNAILWGPSKKNAGKEWMEVDLTFQGQPNATDAVAGGMAPLVTTTINTQSTVY